MPTIDAIVQCPLHDSFRVRQIAGMFDLPLSPIARQRFTVQLPGVEEPWDIGLIVGPSGSGKSTIARQAFGPQVARQQPWPENRAVIDCFDGDIRLITQVLTSVGFSSPPAWLKPYAVLSNGEKFRCDLARAMLDAMPNSQCQTVAMPNAECRMPNENSKSAMGTMPNGEVQLPNDNSNSAFGIWHSALPIVFDEFTSVVDRTVAKMASAALAKAIRSGRIARRFVAVSCHYDINEWLQPDWVLDMADGKLSRGRLRRPEIRLCIRRANPALWRVFKQHHYLNTTLHPAAQCFVGFIENSPAVFTAVLPFPHADRPGWREHRTVCLPDFQGLGIGNAMSEFVAGMFRATGKPYRSVTSHPAMLRYRAASGKWKMTRPPGVCHRHTLAHLADTGSTRRMTASFEYVGPAKVAEAIAFGLIPASPSSGTPGEGWGGGQSAIGNNTNPHPNPLPYPPPEYRGRGKEEYQARGKS